MSKKTEIPDRLHRISGDSLSSRDSSLRDVDGVVIQVTQAFCPKGHNLVNNNAYLFDGALGIHLWVSDGKTSGNMVLSPYHGDHSRYSEVEYPRGTQVRIHCPECKIQLPTLGPCDCPGGGSLIKLYTSPKCQDGSVVAVCDVWGCHRSKVFDQAQLLSVFEEA